MQSEILSDPVKFVAQHKSCSVRPFVLAFLDVAGVTIAGIIAYALISCAHSLVGSSYASWGNIAEERGYTIFMTMTAFVIILLMRGSYHQRIPFWDVARNIVFACFLALLIEGFIFYANKSDVSRLLTFSTWVAAPIVCILLRSLEVRFSHAVGFGIDRVLVIGRIDLAKVASRIVESDRHLGLVVCGSVTPDEIDDLDYVLQKFPDARYVLVALSGSDETENKIVKELRQRGISLILVPVANGLVSSMEARYLIGEESILLIDKTEVLPRVNRLTKRIFDVVFSSVALLIFSIPMLLIAWFIRLDGGPSTFMHMRVGLGGKPFPCIKFRSMSVNADKILYSYLAENEEHRMEWDQTRKLKDDPRVTAFGRFIRKTTLDELPQLINVLRGDMSLVGPRPVTQSEMEYYGTTISLYTSVRPGLTGLWQVSGRSDLSYDQRVRLDIWYVRNWTPWHDIAILLKTFPAVLKRKGAY
jgi:Undecaprenyl-phosphate galactose phosphotransferase WbaP